MNHDLCSVIGGKHRAPLEAMMVRRLMSLRLITFLSDPQESGQPDCGHSGGRIPRMSAGCR